MGVEITYLLSSTQSSVLLGGVSFYTMDKMEQTTAVRSQRIAEAIRDFGNT